MGPALAAGARDLAVSRGNGEKSDGENGLFGEEGEVRGGVTKGGWRDWCKRRKEFIVAVEESARHVGELRRQDVLVDVFNGLLGSEPAGANESEARPGPDGVGVCGVGGEVGDVVLDLGRTGRGRGLSGDLADGGVTSVVKLRGDGVGRSGGGRGGRGGAGGRDDAAVASVVGSRAASGRRR